MYVVERLIDAVVKFDWPKDKLEIQVLDDSTDETVAITAAKVAEYKAKGFDIVQICRIDRVGYKAGALQAGLEVSKGAFIAIFDADFLPQKDFLLQTMPFFHREKCGLVQTRWQHINENYSLLTRVQAFFLDAHFKVEQEGRNCSNYFMNFNGTAGVWRKATIRDAGGWQADTLTEDLDLSYRAQMKGWNFLYLENVLSPAELPADIQSFKSQQFRWIKGGAETAKKILPQITKSNLPFKIKVNAFSHLLSSSLYVTIFLTVLLSVPLLIFKNTYIETEYVHFSAPFLLSNVAVGFVYFISSFDKNNKLGSFLNYLFMLPMFLIITMGLSLHNTLAVIRGFWGEKTPFIRTPKFNILNKEDIWNNKKYVIGKIDKVTIAEGFMSLYFMAGIIYGISIQEYNLIPLHLIAFSGFSAVFIYSIVHRMQSNAG
ncbi:UNVERIFIED_CONTAM: hypothetical protein GTU68_035460 [Idotea baltica]|nr:hypothetical protein [Idotea baltica]